MKSCRLACELIIANLRKGSAEERRKTVTLIEFLVKNCSMRFHHCLLNKKFAAVVLKILDKRRGKLSLLNSLVAKNKALQKEVG